MSEEVWLQFLKDNNTELYNEAKEYIIKQSAILAKTKTELQISELNVERYRNLITSNFLYDSK
jgi:hypothetical protein